LPQLLVAGYRDDVTIKELHENEALRQNEFPVTKNRRFFGHAGVCPLPRRVSEAIQNYATQCTLGDQETLIPSFQIRKSRELAARLLNAKANEISFVGPTSLALSYVASGLPFRKNDNILIYFDDYPSNVYPWMALAEKGVQVRLLNTRELGRIRPMDVLGQVDEQTRLVALASAHFVSGYRLDLEAIGTELKRRGILFCLDSIQTLGAFPTDAAHFDFLAADAHKWLLGPCAAGILLVKEHVQERLRPPVFGWHNVQCANFVAQDKLIQPKDGRRYEVGTENLLGLVGLHAAMELSLEIGVDNIATELLRKREWLVPALQEKRCTVLQAQAPKQNCSGITAFFREGENMADLHRKLEERGIMTSLRTDRGGKNYIRISPHYYNTDNELAALLEML
jgi:cysteine desulfurase/selenocysteine lyase